MWHFDFKGEHFESIVSVILRVPGLVLLDLYWTYLSLDKLWPSTYDYGNIFSSLLLHALLLQGLCILLIPLNKLVVLYMHYISAGLLIASSLISRHYVMTEQDWVESDKGPDLFKTPAISSVTQILTPEAVWKFIREYRPPGFGGDAEDQSLFAKSAARSLGLFDMPDNDIFIFFRRQLSFLGVHLLIATSVSFFLDIECNAKRAAIAVYTLPIVARLSAFPITELLLVHNVATAFLILVSIYYVLNWAPLLVRWVQNTYTQIFYEIHLLGPASFFIDLWTKCFVPPHFLAFFSIHFALQIYNLVMQVGSESTVAIEEWYIVLLYAISQLCETPLQLAATCVAVSYLAALCLALTKIVIQGYQQYASEPAPHAGLTEGLTMALLSAQTGLVNIKMPHRIAAMSIILFVVTASLVQSMYEATEPMLLALSASRSKAMIGRHIKILFLCAFLFFFPLYMTHLLCHIFDLNFWTLVVISTCVMTSVQVVGMLVIYGLFMYDASREEAWESLDEVVYYTRALVRTLEFVVAVFVVGAGFHESLEGQWTWANSTVLVVHCYFNVWQRLQTGWVSFLKRREAARKIYALPPATEEQLEQYSDVCAICYQALDSKARVTPCRHLFHGPCLRKWLYVQEKCPLCAACIVVNDNQEQKAQDVRAENVTEFVEEENLVTQTETELKPSMPSTRSSPHLPELMFPVTTQRSGRFRHSRSKSEVLTTLAESE